MPILFDILLSIGISSVISALLVLVLPNRSGGNPLRRGRRIEVVVNSSAGPTSREHGFTPPAIDVNITNRNKIQVLNIIDIRLMLTKDYGIPIRPKAPADRFHENLPAKLEAQTTETWYFPIEDVSKVLEWFYRPARKAIQTSEYVFLYVRCIMGTGKILYGPWFKLTTDSSAHWPSPEKLRNLAFAELFFREISKRWRYFGTLLSIVFAVIRILGIFGIELPVTWPYSGQ